MVLNSAGSDFDNVIADIGERCLINRFSSTFSGAQYDIEYLTANGSSWVTCAHHPVSLGGKGEHSAEAQYIEEGRISFNDKVVYFAGSITISSNAKIGIGSPTPTQHMILDPGVIDFVLSGVVIYRKVYCRELNTGSFLGQV